MSFFDKETSRNSGQPIELYEFKYGMYIYRYNTTSKDIEIDGNIYKAATFERQSIKLTSDIRRSQLQITAPISFEVAGFFRTSIPASPIFLTLKRKHRNDPEVIVEWIGRVMSAEWDANKVTMTCESFYSTVQKMATFRYYSYSCPHMLFDSKCGVIKNNYKVPVNIEGVNGSEITSSVFATFNNNYFTGGFMMFYDSYTRLTHMRQITTHTGNKITISSPISKLLSNSHIEVYPGCDHTLATCKNKYNNIVNFGGFPWISSKNPFTTTSSIFW